MVHFAKNVSSRPLRAANLGMRVHRRRVAPCNSGVYEGLLRFCVLALAAACAPAGMAAQRAFTAPFNKELPGATGVEVPAVTQSSGGSSSEDSASISGTVVDANGSEVQDANVALKSLNGAEARSQRSGSDGGFTFTSLAAGSFKLVVSGPGWGTFISPAIELHAGDFRLVPNVILPLTSSTVVRVVANREQLAEEQVHIAEQQRVLGVFPNFSSSYDWNAPPLGSKQKFQLALRSLLDPMAFVGAGQQPVSSRRPTNSPVTEAAPRDMPNDSAQSTPTTSRRECWPTRCFHHCSIRIPATSTREPAVFGRERSTLSPLQ